MIIEILDRMLIAYYTLNFRRPSKIVMSISVQKPLESELNANAISRYSYINYCEYKGIPLEFNIRESFISLQK